MTSAIGAASDEVLTSRASAAGRNRPIMRLVAALDASNLTAQAAATLGVAGNRPPPLVIETVARLADSIRTGSQPPMTPTWDTSPGALALRDALAGVARILSRDWSRRRPDRACAPRGVLRLGPETSHGRAGRIRTGGLRDPKLL